MKKSKNTEQVIATEQHALPFMAGRVLLLRNANRMLAQGGHVFIHGEFGIGKTLFARATAQHATKFYGVLDFERGPSETLQRMLLSARRQGLFHRPDYSQYRQKFSFAERKHDRLALAKLDLLFLKEKYGLDTLLLDNIFSYSAQKRDFVRFLTKSGFRLLLVFEAELGTEELMHLRMLCQPDLQLTLHKLTVEDSEKYLQYWNEHLAIEASASLVHQLASQQNGYPLFLQERIQELKEHRPLYSS